MERSQQTVVVAPPVAKPPAVASEQKARNQRNLDVALVDQRGVGPRLHVAKRVSFHRSGQRMKGEWSLRRGPRDNQVEVFRIGHRAEVDFTGHGQEYEDHPPLLSPQHLSNVGDDQGRLFGCGRSEVGCIGAPLLLARVGDGHPSTIGLDR
jgi:hypothetical protein